jgi:hypothetical protein
LRGLLLTACSVLLGCSTAPIYTTNQGIEVYGDNVGHLEVLAAGIDVSNLLILAHLSAPGLERYEATQLVLYLFEDVKDVEEACGMKGVLGCFDSHNRSITIWAAEDCAGFDIVAHELLHLGHWLNNGDADHDHVDVEFGWEFGTIVWNVREFLRANCN